MADQRSIAGRDPLFFRFEDTLQMARLSWYIDVQNLADGGRSFYCLLAMGIVTLLVLVEPLLFELQCLRTNHFFSACGHSISRGALPMLMDRFPVSLMKH